MNEQMKDELTNTFADNIDEIIRIADKHGMDRDETLFALAKTFMAIVSTHSYEKYELSIQTNADRIRSMSDEGLAKLITSGELCAICPFCEYYDTELCYLMKDGEHKNCDAGIIGWLKKEVEE